MATNGWTWINSLKDDYGPTVADAIKKSRQTIPDKVPESLQSSVNRVVEINYAELPEQVKTWIVDHPYQTSFHVINGIVFFYPGLFTGPVCWSLGWTFKGPRAGLYPPVPPCAQPQIALNQLIRLIESAAAALMAKMGVVPSRSAVAYIQSSAMGGYGTTLVQGVTRAGSVGLGALELLTSSWHRPKPKKVDDDAGSGGEEVGLKAMAALEVQAKL